MRISFLVNCYKLCTVLIFVLMGFCCAPQDLRAQNALIKDVAVTNSDTHILAYFKLAHAFTPEMEEGIVNGIPATFTFSLDLLIRREGWPDKEIISYVFDHTLKFDNLKEEYHVELSENGGKVYSTRNLEEAKVMMMEVNDFRVCSLQDLVEGRKYTMRVKASLERKKLPLNFHYFIPFWRFWDFETDYYHVSFRY